LAGAADRLAGAVRGWWRAEAELRGLNDPYVLPVRWRPADLDLVVAPWSSLERLAMADRTGWP
jgi:hypothetical protein